MILRCNPVLLWKLYAAALLLLLGAVLCARISHPWTYNDDYNGAFWSQAARNLSRSGFLSTAGVPAPLYFGAPPIPAEALYVHHPTLLPDMMFADRALLGESEAAARALPIFFSLLAAGLLWFFVSLAAGSRAALFVLAFFVAAPMELHYGQMVNFEAPELFFLLAALCCFHLWLWRRSTASALGLLLCCALAMWTDWQGYLLAIILSSHLLLLEKTGPGKRLSAALLVAAFISGSAFLLQIHLAQPGAWRELLHAFQERSGQGDLSGGTFTIAQWLRTQFEDLTTLFNPLAWILAAAGAALAFWQRKNISQKRASLLHIATVFFLIDAFYVCALRNQSYIHDFAGFYFLIPVAIFAGLFVDQAIPVPITCIILALLIYVGIRKLDGIDTQFCILDDDNSEPATLMPDIGRLIDRTFPPDAVVLCNFDPYYSPLPYYAHRVMANDLRSYADWQSALSDASPHPAAGILWPDAAGAPDLLRNLPSSQLRKVTVDDIPFLLWTPPRRPPGR